MKIEELELIGYLKKISELHDKLEATQKRLNASEKDAMNWFHRWQELKEKYEKEESDDTAETSTDTEGA